MSGFVRNALIGAMISASLGAFLAVGTGGPDLRAQTQLADPKDAPKIFASTCSACHKSPQGLAKSGQVAGFLRQHYTTGPEMSAAMAAYLVAAGSAPASKKGQAEAKAGQGADNPAAKAKAKKQEQAAAAAGQTPAERTDAKEQRTLRGKQLAKSQAERLAAHPSPASAADAASPQAPAPVLAAAPAIASAAPAETHAVPTTPAGPPPVVLDIPLPEMPTAPPDDLAYSAFSSSPLP